MSELAGEIERDDLIADYEFTAPPEDYIPDSMISRQIQLVGGTKREIQSAEREEWRARSQRHKWMSDRVDMATRIGLYDMLLCEAWEDKHGAMSEACESTNDATKQASGLDLFRWSFNQAHTQIRPFAKNWSASYYVRGSYQVLAVQLTVGWHPDFKNLLAEKKP